MRVALLRLTCVAALLVALLFCIGDAAKFARIGPPLSEFPSHSASTFSHRAVNIPSSPPVEKVRQFDSQGVNRSLVEQAHANGLRVDADTLANGDCGLDAMLRNFELMEAPNAAIQEVLAFLPKGRLQALHILRLKLLIWLRDNSAQVLLPGVTVEQWINMDPDMSMQRYLTEMKQPGTWIDTPMLHAASAVFGVQVVIFLPSSQPQLVACGAVMSMASAPVITIANIDNYHFYAMVPMPDEEPVVYQVPEVVLQEGVAEECDSEAGDGCDERVISEQACLRQPTQEDSNYLEPKLFELAANILVWDPWTRKGMDGGWSEILRTVEGEAPALNVSLHRLRCREAVKLCQWEAHDRLANIDRQWHYHIGKGFLSQRSYTTRCQYKTFGKSSKLALTMNKDAILKGLKKDCSRGKHPHSCLNAFRLHPDKVLLWRKLWYSLPKANRTARLSRMYAESNESRRDQFSYQVLGFKLCREAFIAVTGIHTYTLKVARSVGMGLSSPSCQELGIWCSRKPVMYQDARAWLLEYSRTHGDSAPNTPEVYLPNGLKQYFWACYAQQRREQGCSPQTIASRALFIKVWNAELPWVRIRSRNCAFASCSLCDYLKLAVSRSTDKIMRDTLLASLGKHWAFQGAQRQAMNAAFEKSRQNPMECLAVGWDKMNQSKTNIPMVSSLKRSHFMKEGAKIVTSLVGVLVPAMTQRPIFYTLFEDQAHGSNMVCSIMLDILLEASTHFGGIPRRLFVQTNNTYKETKNTITLYCACWLLAQRLPLHTVEFAYLVVGHTHDLIDATFAYVSKALHGQNILSVPELFQCLNRRMKNPPLWKHLRNIFNFKDEQPRHLSYHVIKGIGQPHHVRVYRARDDTICLQCKRWLTDSDWSAPLLLCSPEQVAELSRSAPPVIHPRWNQSFVRSSLNWLEKLKALLSSQGHACDGLDHCQQLLNHNCPNFLPSLVDARAILAKLRNVSPRTQGDAQRLASLSMAGDIERAACNILKGDGLLPSSGAKLITIVNGKAGTRAFNDVDLEPGMLVLFRNRNNASGVSIVDCPVRVGRIIQVHEEHPGSSASAVLEGWWPITNPEHGDAINIFGTWFASRIPVSKVPEGKRAKKRSEPAVPILVLRADILVWPVESESRNDDFPGGARIPFAVFHFLRDLHGIDLSNPRHAWANRGKKFAKEVMEIVSRACLDRLSSGS